MYCKSERVVCSKILWFMNVSVLFFLYMKEKEDENTKILHFKTNNMITFFS